MNKKQAFALLVVTFIFTFNSSVFAKEKSIQNFYKKYKDKVECTSLSFSPALLNLLLIGHEDKDLRQFLKEVDEVKILVFENIKDPGKMFKEELNRDYLPNYFEDLMIIKDGSSNIEFKIAKNGGIYSEFLMSVCDSNSLVLLYIDGKIDLKTINKLSSAINVKGMQHLNKIK